MKWSLAMPIKVQTKSGKVFTFPDGTPREKMKAAIDADPEVKAFVRRSAQEYAQKAIQTERKNAQNYTVLGSENLGSALGLLSAPRNATAAFLLGDPNTAGIAGNVSDYGGSPFTSELRKHVAALPYSERMAYFAGAGEPGYDPVRYQQEREQAVKKGPMGEVMRGLQEAGSELITDPVNVFAGGALKSLPKAAARALAVPFAYQAGQQMYEAARSPHPVMEMAKAAPNAVMAGLALKHAAKGKAPAEKPGKSFLDEIAETEVGGQGPGAGQRRLPPGVKGLLPAGPPPMPEPPPDSATYRRGQNVGGLLPAPPADARRSSVYNQEARPMPGDRPFYGNTYGDLSAPGEPLPPVARALLPAGPAPMPTDGGQGSGAGGQGTAKGGVSAAEEALARMFPDARPVEPVKVSPESVEKSPGSVQIAEESGGRTPSGVVALSPHEIAVDPDRFQYKVGSSAKGLTNQIQSERWRPELAGTLLVWRDPANGKTYAVNGHHRLDLAERTGAPSVDVRYINDIAPTAEDARRVGAIANIAEGRGTPIDAAKLFRDEGISPEALQSEGISLSEAQARNGLALSRLPEGLWRMVFRGEMPVDRGIAVGESGLNQGQMMQLHQMVSAAEKRGKRLTAGEVGELGKFIASAGETEASQNSLFGEETQSVGLAVEMARLSKALKDRLSKDSRLFGFVSKGARAEELTRGGNKIDVEASREIADQSAQVGELFDRLAYRSGPVNAALRDAAAKIVKGEDAHGVQEYLYQRVRTAVGDVLAGRETVRDANPDLPQSEPVASTSSLFSESASGLGEAGEVAEKRGRYGNEEPGREQLSLPGISAEANAERTGTGGQPDPREGQLIRTQEANRALEAALDEAQAAPEIRQRLTNAVEEQNPRYTAMPEVWHWLRNNPKARLAYQEAFNARTMLLRETTPTPEPSYKYPPPAEGYPEEPTPRHPLESSDEMKLNIGVTPADVVASYNRFRDAHPEIGDKLDALRNFVQQDLSGLHRHSPDSWESALDFLTSHSQTNWELLKNLPAVKEPLSSEDLQRFQPYLVADRILTHAINLDKKIKQGRAAAAALDAQVSSLEAQRRSLHAKRNFAKTPGDVRAIDTMLSDLAEKRTKAEAELKAANRQVRAWEQNRNTLHRPTDPVTGAPMSLKDMQDFFAQPGVQQAVAAHKALIEPLLEQYRTESGFTSTGERGHFSGAFTPAIAEDPNGNQIAGVGRLALGVGAGKSLRQPVGKQMALPGTDEFHGTAEHYVGDYEAAIRNRLYLSMRAAKQAGMVKDWLKTGFALTPEQYEQQGRVMNLGGQQVHGTVVDLATKFRKGSVPKGLPERIVVPAPLADEVTRLYNADSRQWKEIVGGRVLGALVRTYLIGPADATAHAATLAGRLALQQSRMKRLSAFDRALSTFPQFNGLRQIRNLMKQAHTDAERRAALDLGVKYGVMPPEFGAKMEMGKIGKGLYETAAGTLTLDAGRALEGANTAGEGTVSLGAHLLYGERGAWINAITTIYKAGKANGLTPREIGEMMQEMNTYLPALRSQFQKFVQPLGLGTFYNTGVTSRMVGMKYANPFTKPGFALLAGSLAFRSIAFKQLDEEHRWPWEVAGAKEGYVPVPFLGKDESGNPFLFSLNWMNRPEQYADQIWGNLLGLAGEQRVIGDKAGRNLSEARWASASNLVNVALAPITSGPIGQAGAAATGSLPFLTESGDRYNVGFLPHPASASDIGSAGRNAAILQAFLPFSTIWTDVAEGYKANKLDNPRVEEFNRYARLVGVPPIRKGMSEQQALFVIERARRQRERREMRAEAQR